MGNERENIITLREVLWQKKGVAASHQRAFGTWYFVRAEF